MFKEVKVVLLPTNEKSNIYLNEYADDKNKADKLVFGANIKEELTSTIEQLENRGYKAQHLYFISDEEIKVGDWCYLNNNIKELPDYNGNYVIKISKEQVKSANILKDCKKIIATTDSSLTICPNKNIEFGCCNKPNFCDVKQNNLPQPNESFIQHYVEEYNKGNIISEVLVEFESVEHSRSMPMIHQKYYVDELKINPKDNTITIKKVKDSWSREEVIDFGLKVLELGFDLGKNPLPRLNEQSGKEYYYKWIKENL